MKIEKIYLNGYGQFFDQEFGPLNQGLNLLRGENEAGKSTLLDFLRGILYGFADGKNPRRQHLPLRGGRHGGSLTILDERSSAWTVERYPRALKITSATGEEASPKVLQEILGYTDDRVFGSIFAFGLSELDDIKRLTEDNVRDAIFSAGIVGAGRSAAQAIKDLDDERSEITRSTKGDLQRHQLQMYVTQRSEIEAELRTAKDQSGNYLVAQHELEQQQRELEDIESRRERFRVRSQELHDLLHAKELRDNDRTARERLAITPSPSEADRNLAGEHRAIDELAFRLESYQHNQRELASRLNEQRQRATKITQGIDQIGITRQQAMNLQLSIGFISDIDRLVSRHNELLSDQQVQNGLLQSAQGELEEARSKLRQVTRDASPDALKSAEMELREIPTIREMTRELQSRYHHAQLQLANGRNVIGREKKTAILVILLLIILLGLGTTISSFGRSGHSATLPGILGVVVLVAGTIGLVVVRNLIAVTRQGSPSFTDQQRDRDELAKRVGERARLLLLPDLPSEAEIDAKERQLRSDGERSSVIRSAVNAVEASQLKFDRVEKILQELESELASSVDQATKLADELGITRTVDPTTLHAVGLAIIDTKELLLAEEEAEESSNVYRDQIKRYEAEVTALFARCNRVPPDPEGIEYAIVRLKDECIQIVDTIRDYELLDAQIAVSEERIAALFARSTDAHRLLSELESKDEESLSDELQSIEIELEVARADYEATLKRTIEIERSLAIVQGSRSIAELEIARTTVTEEISTILRHWSLLSTASLLLKKTFSRYETERQPAVIARAAELFREATNGRYVTLISREDASGRRNLLAVRENGGQIDSQLLSTGTAQLLYLCVRLAYTENFADRSTSLPLILDDVLVNFDPERSAAIARTICAVAERHQVLLFTCQPATVATFTEIDPKLNLVGLPERV